MSPWRLEWYRLLRTRRLGVLVGVFVFFGFLGPLSAYYIDEIVNRFGGGVQIESPPPTVEAAIAQYTASVSQLGLLVVLIAAAGALNVHQQSGLAFFLRTRVPDGRRLLLPRFVVPSAAAAGAFTVGALAAWYETAVLIGTPSMGGMLAGIVLTSIYFVFAVATVALAASVAPSTITAVALATGVLLALPVLGVVDAVADWLPSRLLGALPVLAAGAGIRGFLPAALVALLLAAAGLLVAMNRTVAREI